MGVHAQYPGKWSFPIPGAWSMVAKHREPSVPWASETQDRRSAADRRRLCGCCLCSSDVCVSLLKETKHKTDALYFSP